MKKLLVALIILALPSIAFAQSPVLLRHQPFPSGDTAGTKSLLAAGSDIFHSYAIICEVPAVPCGPDSFVIASFNAVVQFAAPTSQVYTLVFVITDTEGSVVALAQSAVLVSKGFNTFSLTFPQLPNESNVFTGGVYKFISIIVGANGKLAFSDYFRFRQL